MPLYTVRVEVYHPPAKAGDFAVSIFSAFLQVRAATRDAALRAGEDRVGATLGGEHFVVAGEAALLAGDAGPPRSSPAASRARH